MKAIRSKDTRPELLVRKLLTSMGYRYRLHSRDLPGKPDITFKGRKKIVFIHGCFWHAHTCQGGRVPVGEYWQKKLNANMERDKANNQKLIALGWDTLTLWECELNDLALIEMRLRQFLGKSKAITSQD